MSELFEFVLSAFSLLVPDRVKNWMMRQNKIVRTVLSATFRILAICIAVLIEFALLYILMVIINTFLGSQISIKDFPDMIS